MKDYIFYCLVFYFIGSFPTAYLIIRQFAEKDITEEGSGNMGALNSYEVTRSKSLGILVLAIDLLKGFLPAVFLYKVMEYPFSFFALPVACLILGHNFSIWLKFKGGRGLATAAGISLALSPVQLLIWCVLFGIAFLLYRKVHFGNIAATLMLPVIVFISKKYLMMFDTLAAANPEVYISFTLIICLLILLKHIKPFLELIKKS